MNLEKLAFFENLCYNMYINKKGYYEKYLNMV